MKTLSVKQVSEVLGVGTRAVLKRLEKKQLKGIRRQNKFGVEEWWIYPTAEIKEALERAGRIDILSPDGSYTDADVLDIDAEVESLEDSSLDETVSTSETGSWTAETRSHSQDVADGIWNNIIGRFVAELRTRDELIGEMRNEIAEKERQLKLLPDFQKEAEISRKNAELKELESIALSKQIEALRLLEIERAEERERLSKLEGEVIPTLEQQLEIERKERDNLLSEAHSKIALIESYKSDLELSKAQLEASLQQEIERLKREKEEQSVSIQSQFEALNQKLEELQKPKPGFWQKLFGGQS